MTENRMGKIKQGDPYDIDAAKYDGNGLKIRPLKFGEVEILAK